MTKKDVNKVEEVAQVAQEEAVVETEVKQTEVVETPVEEVTEVAANTEVVTPVEPVVETPQVEAPVVEAKAEETKTVETPADETVETEKVAGKNPPHGQEGHKCTKDCPKNPDYQGDSEDAADHGADEADEKKVDSKEDLLKMLLEKFASVESILKQAPTEGAADTGETSKEEAVASEEVVEKPVEEVAVPATEPAVADTTSEGASGEEVTKIADLSKKTEELFKVLSDKDEIIKSLSLRIEKLENQPAPSKIVFSKEAADKKATELQKIEDRLNQISQIRDSDSQSFTTKLSEEAIDLIKQKKAMVGA